MDDRRLLRLAGLALAGGATSALIFSAAHPIVTDFRGHPRHLLEKIAAHPDFYLADHLMIGLSGLPIIAGWFCLARVIQGEPQRVLAQLGVLFGVIGTVFLLLFAVVDGIAERASAVTWDQATPVDKTSAFLAADAVDNIATGMEAFFLLTFFGVAFLLFGLALQRVAGFSTLAARAANVCSLGAIVGALTLATAGPTFTTVVAFRGFVVLLVLWTIFTGVQAWRRGRAIESEAVAAAEPA